MLNVGLGGNFICNALANTISKCGRNRQEYHFVPCQTKMNIGNCFLNVNEEAQKEAEVIQIFIHKKQRQKDEHANFMDKPN